MIPDGWWQYLGRPIHSAVINSKSRHRCVAAARRSGKTSLLQSLCALAASAGQRVWYVAPTYAQCKELFFEPVLAALPDRVVAVNRSELRLDLRGGGTIWCKSSERPDHLLGRGLDLVCLDEAQSMPHTLYDAVVRPLVATTDGRLVVAGTPRGTENPLYRFFDLGQRKLDGWRSWLLTAAQAGMIPTHEVEASRLEADRAGPTARKLWEREWMASFAAFVGQVYPGWDPARHVVDELPFRRADDRHDSRPLPTRVVAGMDFGYSENHAGVIEVTALYAGKRWVAEEVSATGRTVPSYWVPEARRLEARWGVEVFFCDPSQPGTMQHLRDSLSEADVRPAENAVEEGCWAVAGEIEGDRLRVHRSCEQLIRRLPAYVWDQVQSTGLYRQKPKKVADDELDALRYAIASELVSDGVSAA